MHPPTFPTDIHGKRGRSIATLRLFDNYRMLPANWMFALVDPNRQLRRLREIAHAHVQSRPPWPQDLRRQEEQLRDDDVLAHRARRQVPARARVRRTAARRHPRRPPGPDRPPRRQHRARLPHARYRAPQVAGHPRPREDAAAPRAPLPLQGRLQRERRQGPPSSSPTAGRSTSRTRTARSSSSRSSTATTRKRRKSSRRNSATT